MFPPEPFRWLGAMVIRNAVRRKEKNQENYRLIFRHRYHKAEV